MYRVPLALAPAVYIPGLAYEVLVRTRNKLYAAAVFPQNRLPAPVISIGNITLGGTGKTPLVIYVAQTLSNLGWNPAVLTRGYGKTHPNALHILAPGDALPEPALTIGDEPALIRRRVPSAWMGVSKNRIRAGSILSRRDERIAFLLDDGFQHRRLHRNLDIVIIDSSRPFASDRLFPRGTLREPISALQRCDVIVINGPFGSPQAGSVEAEIRKLQVRAPIFHCNQFIQSLTPFVTWQKMASCSPGEFPGCKYPDGRLTAGNPASLSAYLVTALGNPKRFRRDLQQIGIGSPGAKFFSDHHRLSNRDWQSCIQEARRNGADTIIITEKDAVKISEPPDFPVLVAVQSTEMADAGAFERILRKRIGEPR